MSDHKVNKLIIPKIKACSSSYPIDSYKKETSDLKLRKDITFFSQFSEYAQSSHMRNFGQEYER